MRQFDVFENPNPRSRFQTPYVVVLQSEPATGPHTVIVAPLVRSVEAAASDRIVVPVMVAGEAFVVLFQAMAAVPRKQLAIPVAHLPTLRDDIALAIDFLFLGF